MSWDILTSAFNFLAFALFLILCVDAAYCIDLCTDGTRFLFKFNVEIKRSNEVQTHRRDQMKPQNL